jgi:GTPase involved in cell partitioning and DNA repair
MIVHVLSLSTSDAMGDYTKIKDELAKFSRALEKKDEWIVLTKADCVSQEDTQKIYRAFALQDRRIFVVSSVSGEGVRELQHALSTAARL